MRLAWFRGPAFRLPLVAAGLIGGRSPHSEAERSCLSRHAAGRRTLVELGVYEGVCTRILRRAMENTGTIYAVDPFPPGRFGFSIPRLIARIGVSRVRNGRVRWLRMTEAGAAPLFRELEPGGADLVFSDCVFTRVELEREWSAWRELVAPGGIYVQSTSQVVAPRTARDHPMVQFAREVLMNDPDFELVETVGTFTVLRRRAAP